MRAWFYSTQFFVKYFLRLYSRNINALKITTYTVHRISMMYLGLSTITVKVLHTHDRTREVSYWSMLSRSLYRAHDVPYLQWCGLVLYLCSGRQGWDQEGQSSYPPSPQRLRVSPSSMQYSGVKFSA